jgi:DNA mismatch repair protein MutS2
VLLDELGAGTDPVEGSALARAICERLLARECLGVCTTHYAELKAFAHNTPGVQNASVEFDVDTLAPTYRLTVGLPGRSNALAIATRLGLDTELVQSAQGSISSEEVQIESLLANIHREREQAAAELQRAAEIRADAEKYRERHAEMLHELEEAMQTRLDDVEQQLEQELRELRNEMRRLRDESRSTSLSRKWSQEAEQRMQEMQEQFGSRGRAIAGRVAVPAAPVQEGPRLPRVGDIVTVPSLKLSGEVLSIDEEDQVADVQVGGFRVHVDMDELQRGKRRGKPEPEAAPEPPVPQRAVSVPPQPEVPMSFDMRGWRAADVSDKLDRYLNDAYLAGLPSVRIVHGKGSGVLRQVVRDMLRQHPLVQSFTGGGAEGGEGVTIARLTER